MAVLSPEDKSYRKLKKISHDSGFTTCDYSNKYLGEKLNAGHYAIGNKYDYLMNWGSDDLINPEMFDVYSPFMEMGLLFFGIGDLIIYEQATGRAIEIDTAHRVMGAGRMIHRKLYQSMKTVLWSDNCNRALDGNSQSRILRTTALHPRRITTHKPMVVDIKTNNNINSFEKLLTFKEFFVREIPNFKFDSFL
jgi:hypothetical protein